MRIACWKTKATNIHSEYVIIIDFQEQQWLYKRASMLRLNVVIYSNGKVRFVSHSNL
jgi:hypothetical protein